MTSDLNNARSYLSSFISAAYNLLESWHDDLNVCYPECLPSFEEFCGSLSRWGDAVDEASKPRPSTIYRYPVDRRAALNARVVKLYTEGAPHADADAALRLISSIMAPNADLKAIEEEIAEQEEGGPDLNVCADCGGSTAPGTPDPHECAPVAKPFPDLLTQAELATRQGFPALSDPSEPVAVAADGSIEAILPLLKAEGMEVHWEGFLSCFFVRITDEVSLVYGTQHGPWQGNLMTEDGETKRAHWPAWEPRDLPTTATAAEVAAVVIEGYRAFKALGPIEIELMHGDYRVRYSDRDRSGEGIVHIDVFEDGAWREVGMATYGEHVGGWNDVGDCEDVSDGDMDVIGTLISDILTAENEKVIGPVVPPLASRHDAATWISALADAFTNDNGRATTRAKKLVPSRLAETIGSFLDCVHEDYEHATDAADFGKRVAATLTGLFGNLKSDIGMETMQGATPWDFALEIGRE